jgi:hypothetical protein
LKILGMEFQFERCRDLFYHQPCVHHISIFISPGRSWPFWPGHLGLAE